MKRKHILITKPQLENIIKDNHTFRIGYAFYKVILDDKNYKLLTIDLNNNNLDQFHQHNKPLDV